ncbi:hypothetical protein C8R48DRAFT_834842 [Suillus tomentosus]|nr:hypothetical protein C8R48DRAFT_834842 [Suillus tomentosus]
MQGNQCQGMHSDFFFQFFLELLRYPNTLATIPSSSKLPTILSAPSNMLPSSFAGLPMVPELDAAGTLVFCPSLEWEADAQEGLYESPFCYKPRALRCSKDYEDGVAHDHDFEFVQADQLDYILDNQGNGFEDLQRVLQTSMATQPDLSWGSRGPGTAFEELCRMTNDGLESLPDIQPFTSATFPSWKDLSSSHKITLARAFQAAAARQLCAKLTRSLQKLKLKDMIVMDVVVSGGVASNIFLRERLRAALDEHSSDERILLRFPLLELAQADASIRRSVHSV